MTNMHILIFAKGYFLPNLYLSSSGMHSACHYVEVMGWVAGRSCAKKMK
jgi:hypothetical protein